MVVTRQIERGAQLASNSSGVPLHVHIRRIPYLLEPDYPEDANFVESHLEQYRGYREVLLPGPGPRWSNTAQGG